MTTTPTAQQFLTDPWTDEDGDDEIEVRSHTCHHDDRALTSIADSLERLVELTEASTEGSAPIAESGGVSQEEFDELARSYDERGALLARVLEICKPSTSKLANAIRAELAPAPEPAAEEPIAEVPKAAPADNQAIPADEAPTEEWQAYGRSFGLEGEALRNRSTIRTVLGLPHPGAMAGAPAQTEEAAQ